jgi:hypothetical protein
MTDDIVDFLPTTDPLMRRPRLDYRADLPVLGVETRFQTNSRYVLGIVEEAFGGWRGLVESPGVAAEAVRVRIIVSAGHEQGAGHAPVRSVCPDATRVIIHTPGSVAVSDPARRESVAYVTTELAADRAHFRGAMLEAITFALLSHFDRHPIHAAAIARGGRAVLLAGHSGAGKSTLAYLAHTAGIDVLSEDHVWVQLTPVVRLWRTGESTRVRLTQEASSHFPEVEQMSNSSDGEEKREVSLNRHGRGDVRSRLGADCAGVCILDKAGGVPALARLGPDAIIAALTERPAPGFDRFPDRQVAVAHALAQNCGWKLTLSDDPRAALPLLLRMLDEA